MCFCGKCILHRRGRRGAPPPPPKRKQKHVFCCRHCFLPTFCCLMLDCVCVQVFSASVWSLCLVNASLIGNRARRHAKTNPGDIKGPSQYKPFNRQGHFWHVNGSLLARRRVTFGMWTGRYYSIFYYFPARGPSNTLNRISTIFPFSLLRTKEFETFSLFQY